MSRFRLIFASPSSCVDSLARIFARLYQVHRLSFCNNSLNVSAFLGIMFLLGRCAEMGAFCFHELLGDFDLFFGEIDEGWLSPKLSLTLVPFG